MISSIVVPAIIPVDEGALYKLLQQLGTIPEIHIDLVDGSFVPFTAWPYDPVGDPRNLANFLSRYTVEVDLMVSDPLLAAATWLAAGADRLIFHVETISVSALAAFAETTDVTVGIAANNDTDFSQLSAFFPFVDFVQVMGIAAIGTQGQPFDERALTRIAAIRAADPELEISIDGSVNETTLPRIAPAKVDRYIVGSAIALAPEPRRAYEEFSVRVASL